MTQLWDEPYLETCCRAALHRLILSGTAGRPDGLKDGRCLHRLAGMGLASMDLASMDLSCAPGGRFAVTEAGVRRHRQEILRERAA